MYEVEFLNANKEHVVRKFDSPYKARLFVNKLRRSKTCVLLAYPVFD